MGEQAREPVQPEGGQHLLGAGLGELRGQTLGIEANGFARSHDQKGDALGLADLDQDGTWEDKPLAEIKELNAVYGIGGSTGAMLRRLEELLARHRAEVDERIGELAALREEIDRYREHVGRRVEGQRSRGGSS